ncbi:MAG: glutamine-hydrolyzing carbamoyl-phosphate synthase small subunit [bacterium]|nr:glutamine-hydrolyzing carbamoyl-phosphate synthase small subunit [bacterium]
MKAVLVLEDGRIFRGESFGAEGTCFGEAVFNTSMTGYQEILTDPSYKGQMVCMTYPLIGNYGINDEDVESRRIFLEGFIVKECSSITSNWRSRRSLPDYLKENNVPAIQGIDTRALTRHLRLKGAMKAILTTEDRDEKELVRKVKEGPSLVGQDLVRTVTCDRPYWWNEKGKLKVVVLDCGVKYNILRMLALRNCRVYVMPSSATAEQILKENPDGVLLSNGPGDPEPVANVIETVKGLTNKVPLFGICLGQQMLGLALAGRTFKLKFGHHGANHPVKDLRTGRVAITVQNHGFCVDLDSLPKQDIEITHVNLNDGTLEGFRHKKYPLFSVQFHPEASAGPHDAEYLFGEFIDMVEKNKK